MLNWFNQITSAKRFKLSLVGASFMILSLVAIAFATNIISTNQNSSDISDKEKQKLIKEVKESPGVALRIKQDGDAPFKILEAKVKEVSKDTFQKLTGKNAESQIILSVPEVKFLNTSNKTVKKLKFKTRDESAKRSKGLIIRELSIEPGETYILSRKQFVPKETIKIIDESGNFKEVEKSEVLSERYWLPFSNKSELQVSVSVEFEEGETK